MCHLECVPSALLSEAICQQHEVIEFDELVLWSLHQYLIPNLKYKQVRAILRLVMPPPFHVVFQQLANRGELQHQDWNQVSLIFGQLFLQHFLN